MYKTVKAIALGTVATSIGIMHFDPDRKGEDKARYLGMILPNADAEKAKRRELVEITGDATAEEFRRQQLGFGVDLSRIREDAAATIADASERADNDGTTLLGAEAAASTTNIRNHSAGQRPEDVPSGVDVDAPPIPGASGAGASDAGASDAKAGPDAVKVELPAALRQQNAKVLEHVKNTTDAAEIDALLAAEQGRGEGKTRDVIVKGLEARKAELAK